MSTNIILRLFILGLSATELKLLSRVVELSERRACQLILLPDEQASNADVIIANYSYPLVRSWVESNTRLVLSKPVIWIDSKNNPPMHHGVQRPIQWSQLLLIIKQAIVKRRQFNDDEISATMLDEMLPLHSDLNKVRNTSVEQNITETPASNKTSTQDFSASKVTESSSKSTQNVTKESNISSNIKPNAEIQIHNDKSNIGLQPSIDRASIQNNYQSNEEHIKTSLNLNQKNDAKDVVQSKSSEALPEKNLEHSEVKKPTKTDQDKQKVLVVDDSQVARDYLKVILEEQGYHVTLAKNGTEAIDRFNPTRVDCILMDVLMPEMDGYEACRQIKRKARVYGDTPIIMLTSKSSPFDKIKGKMAGCDAYLTKPVKLDKLKKSLVKFTKSTQKK